MLPAAGGSVSGYSDRSTELKCTVWSYSSCREWSGTKRCRTGREAVISDPEFGVAPLVNEEDVNGVESRDAGSQGRDSGSRILRQSGGEENSTREMAGGTREEAVQEGGVSRETEDDLSGGVLQQVQLWLLHLLTFLGTTTDPSTSWAPKVLCYGVP